MEKNIFTDEKTATIPQIVAMREVIEQSLTSTPKATSYQDVSKYLASNPGWKKSYFAWRKPQELPYVTQNALIWEIVEQALPKEAGAW